MKIEKFQGEHRFLSNFWPCRIEYAGLVFTSVEHAYVAAKTTNKIAQQDVAALKSPGEAKRYGRRLKLRPDWDVVKYETMLSLVRQKFTNLDLADWLRNTGAAQLIEGNTWGDTYWGVCDGVGENNLGKILMQVRAEL